jgi:hypothetical protein
MSKLRHYTSIIKRFKSWQPATSAYSNFQQKVFARNVKICKLHHSGSELKITIRYPDIVPARYHNINHTPCTKLAIHCHQP